MYYEGMWRCLLNASLVLLNGKEQSGKKKKNKPQNKQTKKKDRQKKPFQRQTEGTQVLEQAGQLSFNKGQGREKDHGSKWKYINENLLLTKVCCLTL